MLWNPGQRWAGTRPGAPGGAIGPWCTADLISFPVRVQLRPGGGLGAASERGTTCPDGDKDPEAGGCPVSSPSSPLGLPLLYPEGARESRAAWLALWKAFEGWGQTVGFLFLEGLFLSVKREPLASWEE